MAGTLELYLYMCDDPECLCMHACLFLDDDDKPPGIGMVIDRGEYYYSDEFHRAEAELVAIAKHWGIAIDGDCGERRTTKTLRELWACAGERWRDRDAPPD